MINLVLPMAGEGSRFVNAGFRVPKPFIDVNGEPMITKVLKNLTFPGAHFYLIARKEHLSAEPRLAEKIKSDFPVTFIPIDKKTEGAACTVLHARKFINCQHPLLMANSDQLVDMKIKDFVDDCFSRKLDGSILTFKDTERNPKWSFAKIGPDGLVVAVKEKEAISEHATVGIYLYSKGSDFVNAAVDMIVQNDRVNNEFYTCPVYNYSIKEGKRIGIFDIQPDQMHGLGTPEDLERYLKSRAIK
jgi:dTDP-glucose pyrophosphorylase